MAEEAAGEVLVASEQAFPVETKTTSTISVLQLSGEMLLEGMEWETSEKVSAVRHKAESLLNKRILRLVSPSGQPLENSATLAESGLFDGTSVTAVVQPRSDKMRIIMVGLDNAGKTALMYRIKLNELITTIPTIGFNVETLEVEGVSMTIWDVGGQSRVRSLWKHYYQGTNGIIFVVDSSDPARIEEARTEMWRFHDEISDREDMADVAFLVFANKQDDSAAMSVAEVAGMLGLKDMFKQRHWHVEGTSAITSEGILDGLKWLSAMANPCVIEGDTVVL